MALDHSDLIVVLGARFSDRVAGDREKFGKQAKILQLDVDLAEVDKNVLVDRYLIGDLKETLTAINGLLEPQDHREWLARMEAWKTEAPRRTADPGEAPGPHPHYPLFKFSDGAGGYPGHRRGPASDVGGSGLPVFKARTFLTSGGLGTWATDWEPA